MGNGGPSTDIFNSAFHYKFDTNCHFSRRSRHCINRFVNFELFFFYYYSMSSIYCSETTMKYPQKMNEQPKKMEKVELQNDFEVHHTADWIHFVFDEWYEWEKLRKTSNRVCLSINCIYTLHEIDNRTQARESEEKTGVMKKTFNKLKIEWWSWAIFNSISYDAMNAERHLTLLTR